MSETLDDHRTPAGGVAALPDDSPWIVAAEVTVTREPSPGARRRRRIGLFLGPAMFLGIVCAPLGLTDPQRMLASLMAFAITYWVTEAIPVPITSILVMALAVVLEIPPERPDGISSADTVFGAFASPTLFLLIGSFIIALSMMKHGLSRRLAFAVLSLPVVGRSTRRLIVAFGVLGALLSSVIDNGAVVAMLLPIALGLNRALSARIRAVCPEAAEKERLCFSTALILMMSYSTTVGALLTPVGDASNMIGRSFIESEMGVRVPFVKWVLLATPIVTVMIVVLSVIVLTLSPPEVDRLPGMRRWVRAEREQIGPLTRGEINTALVVGMALVLWLLPSVVGLVAGDDSALHLEMTSRFDPAVVAVLAAAALFVLPVDWAKRRFTLTWDEAKELNWGLVLLVGSALSLASLMRSTGLAERVGTGLAEAVGQAPPALVYLGAAGMAISMSELTSNLASVSTLVPIVPSAAASAGVEPVTSALIVTFASVYGFMLPISTSANAMAYSSGLVPITKMMRIGAAVDVSGVVLVSAGLNLMLNVVSVP
jgi:sodium-dependent dicarboxylate transporter 2/3/5